MTTASLAVLFTLIEWFCSCDEEQILDVERIV